MKRTRLVAVVLVLAMVAGCTTVERIATGVAELRDRITRATEQPDRIEAKLDFLIVLLLTWAEGEGIQMTLPEPEPAEPVE